MLCKCPTCNGRGDIVDPKLGDGPHWIGGPLPRVTCQSCGGSGWIEDNTPRKRAPIAPVDDEHPYSGSRPPTARRTP